MDISKDDQDHKEKYSNTFKRNLSQVNGSSYILFLEIMTNVNFFLKNCSNAKVKRLGTNRKILSQGIFL